ncbi:MAG: DUF2784 domain-containing protein [Sulfuricella sp.]|nr:DUF2784 domain-containing protein [Sulfuricella sp.]
MAHLADAILAVHFLFVLFVAGGLPAIWVGAARGWRWVRNRRFRIAHLGAILFVSAESLAGIACPLTVWEDLLRDTGPAAGSFMQRWIGRLLYHNLPEWAFAIAYALFALLTLATWRAIRPRN